jgi:hypothetical protein
MMPSTSGSGPTTNGRSATAGRGAAGPWLRIEAPYFVACVDFAKDTAGRWSVVAAAPILGYMVGWDAGRVRSFLDRKGWAWGWLK